MHKKNWFIVSCFVVSIIVWIVSDHYKQQVIFESGKKVAEYQSGDKTFTVAFKVLEKVSKVFPMKVFSQGNLPTVMLSKKDFLETMTADAVASFSTTDLEWFDNTISVDTVFVKDGILYKLSQKRKVTVPELSQLKSIEYIGEGQFLVSHEFNEDKVSKGAWFGFFRLIAFLSFLASIFYWVYFNTRPVINGQVMRNW